MEAEARRVHHEGLLLDEEQLRMSCGMAAPADLLTDGPRLHLRLRLDPVRQG